jgi:hypothetical protein
MMAHSFTLKHLSQHNSHRRKGGAVLLGNSVSQLHLCLPEQTNIVSAGMNIAAGEAVPPGGADICISGHLYKRTFI